MDVGELQIFCIMNCHLVTLVNSYSNVFWKIPCSPQGLTDYISAWDRPLALEMYNKVSFLHFSKEETFPACKSTLIFWSFSMKYLETANARQRTGWRIPVQSSQVVPSTTA